MFAWLLQNGAAIVLLLLSGGGGDVGEAMDGVGASERHSGRLLVSAGCGKCGAPGLEGSFAILSLKEHQKYV
jgi:hypothetical protein